ncbi:MAG: putative sugar O-methyltransferase [bacterium]|nr:putative sugar O-methyltransferase [bacterium]
MENSELKQLKQKLDIINSRPEKDVFYSKYPLGIIWIRNIFKVLDTIIREDSTAEEKLQSVQNTVLFNVDSQNDIIKEKSFQCWDSFFKIKGIDLRALDPVFQESSYYQKKNTFVVFNKSFSLDFLRKLNLLFDIEKYCKNISNFLEIGGGFGAQARLVKLKYPSSRYVMIDLPETLYFAYINLRLNFPRAKIIFPGNKEEVEKYISSQDYDFLLVPCFFSDHISNSAPRIDIAINTSSLGEMTNRASKYYIDLLEKKLNVKCILLLNRFLNNFDPVAHPQRLQENGCFAQLGSNWKIIHWEIDPEFTNFPFHEQMLPRELYFIADKYSEPEEPDIKDIFLHYWYRAFDTQPTYNSKHNHSICIDRGENGVLYRLVNSVRINPNPKNLDALIKYLYTLEGRFPFEERYYYMDLYRKIAGKTHPLTKKHYRTFHIDRFISETKLLYVEKFLNKIHLLDKFRRLRWRIIKHE